MQITQAQATRFYETLAMLISKREGVDIRVVSVVPREEAEHGSRQDGKAYSGLQECKTV